MSETPTEPAGKPKQSNARSWIYATLGVVFVIIVIAAIASGGGDDSSSSSSGSSGSGSTSSTPSRPTPSAPDPADSGGPIAACRIADDFVKDPLRSPSSADFGSGCGDVGRADGISSETGNTYNVGVVVDSENAFGAELRSEWLAVVVYLGGDRWRLEDLLQLR